MHRLYPLLHLAKEPCVFSEIKSITLHLCGFTFIYAEIKSNKQQIWILSEGSWDTEDLSNDPE